MQLLLEDKYLHFTMITYISVTNWFSKGRAMCYHVYVKMHVQDPYLSAVTVEYCVKDQLELSDISDKCCNLRAGYGIKYIAIIHSSRKGMI